MDSNNDCHHVVLLPFMARGHLIPFLALAKMLERKTPFKITIVNTPLNIQWLSSCLPQNSSISLAEIPFNCTDHGLPPNTENTHTLLPPHLVFRFYDASSTLKPSFDRYIASMQRRPICIIADNFTVWSVDTARRFGTYHAIFETSGAYSSAVFASVLKHLPHRHTDADVFSLLDFSYVKLRRSEVLDDMKNMDEDDPWWILFTRIIADWRRSDGVVVNTVEEMEPESMKHLREKVWSRAWAIGPLLSPSSSSPSLLSSLTGWLDLHPRESVLYVSFGSQNRLNTRQMMELAKGLEASGRPFVWVIRPPTGFDAESEFRAEWLPEGFEDRMMRGGTRRGVLVKEWAPQIDILAHESVGAFLSHCGWNSVLESLNGGVPIIGWPMAVEQPFNLKQLVEELGVGVEMAMGMDAEICGDDVAELIGWVLDVESESGKEMRRKAKEIKKLMEGAYLEEGSSKGSSLRALEDFFQLAISSMEDHGARSSLPMATN